MMGSLWQFPVMEPWLRLWSGCYVGGVSCSDLSDGRHYQEVAGLKDLW